MKVTCANPECSKTIHTLAVKLGMPGTGEKKEGKWFCSNKCYSSYQADIFIEDKRCGLKKSIRRSKLGLLLLKNYFIDKEQLTLALEENGQVRAYAGGYDDWLWQRPRPEEEPPPQQLAPKAKRTPRAAQPRKITSQEREELAELPQRIEALEAEQAALYAAMSDPQTYQGNPEKVPQMQARLDALEAELEGAFARWEELDALPEG